jgi:hypothetical protein
MNSSPCYVHNCKKSNTGFIWHHLIRETFDVEIMLCAYHEKEFAKAPIGCG